MLKKICIRFGVGVRFGFDRVRQNQSHDPKNGGV